MFKSIFTRLLATYLFLILLLTGSLAVLLSYAVRQQIFHEKDKTLTAAAAQATAAVDGYYRDALRRTELQTTLDNLGYVTDSTIYAVRVDKASLSEPGDTQVEAVLAEDYLREDLRRILEGESVYRKRQFSRLLATDVAFKGVPLTVDQKIIGAVLVFAPLSETTAYLTRVNSVIAGTALAAVIISTCFIYVTAARISRPLRTVEQTARRLAAGEAVDDLSIRTGDEVEKLAASFNYLKQQLATTERIRQEFIANVSHDLRTPLTSINGFIRAMLDGLVPPDQYPKYLGLMQGETQRLMRLTSDILELAKIQSGNLRLDRQELPATAVLEEVVAAAGPVKAEKQITVTIDCPSELKVYTDPDRFRQIIRNLLNNAYRFTDIGGTIILRVREEKDRTVVFVQDNGAGIAAADLPHIFERFYRGGEPSRRVEGTGLGLSIVRHLVESHGGAIRVESEAGRGTVFIFYLPR